MRILEQKKALFRRIAELLGESPGIRPEDVFVSLVEVAKENWFLDHGLAQDSSHQGRKYPSTYDDRHPSRCVGTCPNAREAVSCHRASGSGRS